MPTYSLMSGGPNGVVRMNLTISTAVDATCVFTIVEAEAFARLLDIHIDNMYALLGRERGASDE